MLVADFDFDLPPDLVAQTPPVHRDGARLMVVDRVTGSVTHAQFLDLPEFLEPGDVLVVNDSRVFPARLLGRRLPTGGAVECLLLGRLDDERWDALVHPGQRLKPGARVGFEGSGARLLGQILEYRSHGRRVLRLWTEDQQSVEAAVDAIGHVPLPPYITRPDAQVDRERYQTIFARARGSVAAPTAGLHFSDAALRRLESRGVQRVALTLHVGYGTFKPVRVDRVEDHVVDPEPYRISDEAADTINRALADRRRLVVVGTTTTRALETAVLQGGGRVAAGEGTSDLFIHPGFHFRAVGALLTNFHLPRSSLLMLVAAFAGREAVLHAYRDGVAHRYRFYSYGDAMLIL